MGKDNVLLEKSFALGVRCFHVAKVLREQRQEYVLSKQLLRCGTSIGANAEEANATHTKRGFAGKLQISLKEAREAHYWVRMLKAVDILSDTESSSLLQDIDEIIFILTAILKTTRENMDS